MGYERSTAGKKLDNNHKVYDTLIKTEAELLFCEIPAQISGNESNLKLGLND